MKRRLARADVRFNDTILGIADSGHVDTERMRTLVSALPDGVTELYVHPATRRWAGVDALPASYRPEAELAALLDGSVRATVASSGAVLTSFRDLEHAPSSAAATHPSFARARA